MRLTVLWWLVGLCAVCAATRADQPGPVEPPFAAEVEPSPAPLDPSKDPVYVCPMDPDVRSHNPGTCRRCGMNLVAGIPDPVEFHLDLSVLPRPPHPNQPAALQFVIHDPWKDRPVTTYNVVHEKLLHAFVVSEDLQFFEHAHPTFVAEGVFQLPVTFPHSGMFRVLADFYPAGATPQLTTKTVLVTGEAPPSVSLTRDYAAKAGENMHVSLMTIPEEPVVGMRTQLRLILDPALGVEKYLGAWGHMLIASNDLIDMLHQHPSRTDDEQRLIEFETVFPRAVPYRVWVQFQREGVVNTVHFDVPVAPLPAK